MKQKKRFPCGQSRREAIWKMGCGFTGIALADLLARESFLGSDANAEDLQSSNPIAPKKGHHKPRAKSCIFLTMNGAPSQV
ncbi:MAG: DUF1501 domain-containing protein, partial [Rubripirellula sp.]